MKKLFIFTLFFSIGIINQANARVELGYMMRFATFSYTPRQTNQGIDGNIYNLNGNTGTDTYFSINGFRGNTYMNLFTNVRSTTFVIPSSVPVVPVPNNPQEVQTAMTGFKLGFGKGNIMPFIGLISDQVIYLTHQNTPTATFRLLTETINYFSVGATMFGTGNKPNIETRGSMELMIPATAPTINNRAVETAYITQINVEIKFGKNKNFGLMGSLGFHDYKDINEYHMNFFSGGIMVGF